MKIAIPVLKDQGTKSKTADHFGRSPYFTIINTEKNQVKTIPNKSEHTGGTGKPPELLNKKDVDTIICSNLGPKAIQLCGKKDIKVYIGARENVEKTMEAWEQNKLNQATTQNACQNHKH
ncbi:NifB/NifX family molybdenum-iron cluster-binding protein [Methanonatronarchaeum sp. AMET-Sl]|uniref:NifB/NifX family molybdenum-iron cluster-binding protein n=1 Tax=Methanonatronarchaeum sp. AMET-Sl TaxID=3037654 RepID=UPI00244E3121|nr:NifB/NifX family molybdenum-iron cluster-binding protein [Methanonatronarchaeum sp. AMET-Sl]WGI17480.1 NifB/NifX family molybdenum-iron cluster-binding protein [Methanonatronarchaeum sp. AMET-Sl]